ncbi:MAG: phosphonate C-P lyase system protein PhnG [Cereibacter sp.]
MTVSVPPPDLQDRRTWMGLLARARPERLAELAPDEPDPGPVILRQPEIGTVMVQGRIGAAGSPFNLGEMTVTRCSLRLESGALGHAHVQGRSKDHARRAALVDALMQTGRAAQLRRDVLEPLLRDEAGRRRARAEKAAATKVEFFTLVRGEDR